MSTSSAFDRSVWLASFWSSSRPVSLSMRFSTSPAAARAVCIVPITESMSRRFGESPGRSAIRCGRASAGRRWRRRAWRRPRGSASRARCRTVAVGRRAAHGEGHAVDVDRLAGDVGRRGHGGRQAVLQHRVGRHAAADAELQACSPNRSGRSGRSPGRCRSWRGHRARRAGDEHAVAGAGARARPPGRRSSAAGRWRPRCASARRWPRTARRPARRRKASGSRPGRRTGRCRRRRSGWRWRTAARARCAARRRGWPARRRCSSRCRTRRAARAPAAGCLRRRRARSRSATITTLLASTARWLVSVRPIAASARSARAAAAGSSLALATRLPLVILSCISASSAWRRTRLSMPES